MARLSVGVIGERVAEIAARTEYDREILFALLAAYGKSKSTLARLRSGSLNVAADSSNTVALKNVVSWHEVPPGSDLYTEFDRVHSDPQVLRFTPRFIVVTDYERLLALDTKTQQNRIFPLAQLGDEFTFFLPWAGMEKTQYVADTHADVKAAQQMAKLYDDLVQANRELYDAKTGKHAFNIFFTRLLFCYFAEDTGVFADGQFTNAIGSHTLEDGSDTRQFLAELFAALDTLDAAAKPAYLRDFPYVNGSLFAANSDYVVPEFTRKARETLIGLGTLNWQQINPDIFGSMFQAVVAVEDRASLGQHYTSVPNILKTIEPLFLNDLREEFDAAFDSQNRLYKLLDRISKIKIFDPACGSGNFLVIAYKELRRLEHAILARLWKLGDKQQASLFAAESRISIENFYGIEIEDFAAEMAVLSLWIAKHQMNREFLEQFGVDIPLIPLKESGNILAANATRINWQEHCPNDGAAEIYLIGNPPYLGSTWQKPEQKADFPYVFGERKYSKNLDYVALWFVKGADYIRGTRAQLAFVSTNSVSQGQHVSLMFPTVLAGGIEIGYAYPSFKWENNAKHNAGVTVVVISLRNKSAAPKYIFEDEHRTLVGNINSYLTNAPDVYIDARKTPLSSALQPMSKGSQPTDGGNLILLPHEKEKLLSEHPETAPFLKRFVGADDYINGGERWCIWVTDQEAEQAESIQPLKNRFAAVSAMRAASPKAATQKLADHAYKFAERRHKPTDSIIVPRVSSEHREYVPIGFLDSSVVISDRAFAVYDAEPWLFALLTSKMHMVWLASVGGRLKTDYSYANTIVYNNFPVPELGEEVKQKLTERALRVLDVREYYSEYTLAEIYDAEKMPANLRIAHKQIDELVDSIYSAKPFESDEARLALLFQLYVEMSAAADDAAAKKTTRPRRKTARS